MEGVPLDWGSCWLVMPSIGSAVELHGNALVVFRIESVSPYSFRWDLRDNGISAELV